MVPWRDVDTAKALCGHARCLEHHLWSKHKPRVLRGLHQPSSSLATLADVARIYRYSVADYKLV